MTLELFANFAKGLLASNIDASITSVPLTDASAFSSLITSPTGKFRISADTEVMLCTGIAVNTLTVVRGYEGSTAALHTAGAIVKNVLTANIMKHVWPGGVVVQAVTSNLLPWPSIFTKDVVLDQASAGAVTVNIDPASLVPWQDYTFYDGAGIAEQYALILQPNSGLIQKQSNFQLSSNNQSVTFKTDGTNLWIK